MSHSRDQLAATRDGPATVLAARDARLLEALGAAYDLLASRLFVDPLPPVRILVDDGAVPARAEICSRGDRSGGPGTLTVAGVWLAAVGDSEVLCLLAHHMAHVWQRHHGTPGRRGYHNGQWAAKMRAIGLWPSTSGVPGGAQTGESVRHYLVPEGRLANVLRDVAPLPRPLVGGEQGTPPPPAPRSSLVSRRKDATYRCLCGAEVRGRSGISLICGDCRLEMAEQKVHQRVTKTSGSRDSMNGGNSGADLSVQST